MLVAMKLVRSCVPSGTHFLFLLTSFFLFINSHNVSAHTVVFSEYSLQYANGQWHLLFIQKTSYLRDAIYAVEPGLKGQNLNCDDFLEATSNYLTSTLKLKYRGNPLRIEPQYMRYGGLRFESGFLVEGLPEDPDYLTIRSDGFDTHEHSIVLFRVAIEDDAYVNYFNQDQRLATFDFASHSYVFEEVKSDNRYKIILLTIFGLLLVAGVGKFIRSKKG